MKVLRLVSVLAVCVVFTGPVFATPAPPGVTPSLAAEVPVEITPVHSVAHGNGPIVVNWHFKNGTGLVNLTVSPDGAYRFSGNYKRKEPGKIFHVELALKSRVGAVYLFRYTGDASNAVRWSEKSGSAILKEDFKYFAPGHEWAGTYGLSLTAEAKKRLREQQKDTCQTMWRAIGWSSAASVSFPKYCKQFNTAW